jgi:hypothetical protein
MAQTVCVMHNEAEQARLRAINDGDTDDQT